MTQTIKDSKTKWKIGTVNCRKCKELGLIDGPCLIAE